MANAEHETIILINQEDLKEGFFTISTTYKPHALKITKRTGIEPLKISKSLSDSADKEYFFRVPKGYLRAIDFGLKKTDQKRPSNKPKGFNPFKKA